MKKRLLAVAASVLLLAAAGICSASADLVTLTDSTASAANISTTAADRFIGAGAWEANGVDKAEFYMTPEALFGHSTTMHDIASISWSTKKSGIESTPDWYAMIYTVKQTGDTNWYHNRLAIEPYLSRNLDAPANQWNRWSTDSGTNQLTIYDSTEPTPNYGYYGAPTLESFTDGVIDWTQYPASGRTTTVDYASQQVKYITLQTGSGWAAGFTGLLDAFTISLKNGESITLDFESDAAGDVLWLGIDPANHFVQPGGSVPVTLNMSALSTAASGYEAFMAFDPTLSIGPDDINVTAVPFGMRIWDVVSADDNTIDLAGGVNHLTGQAPSQTPAVVANLMFTAGPNEGTAQVKFRDNVPPTMLTDDQGNEIVTATGDSPVVIIDGTAPGNVTISSDPSTWTNAESAALTFSAEDPLSGGVSSGIDHYELSVDGGASFVAVSPHALDISGFATGPHSFSVTAYDRAGNSASASTTLDVDRTDPVITIDSATQGGADLLLSGTAIQGDVEILVSASDADSGLAGPPTVTVTAGTQTTTLTATAVDSDTWSYTYTVTADTANGIATINATVSDTVGSSSSAQAEFEVNKTKATVTVELAGVTTATQRMITFVIGGTGEAGTTEAPLTYTVPVDFDSSGVGIYTFTNLPYNGAWTKISAKDNQHTLRQLVDLSVDGNLQYAADFTGADAFIGGDATDDNLIDIRDFSVFAGQYGTDGHPVTGRDADFSCDGTVYTEDFTFITNSFLAPGRSTPGTAVALSMSAAEPMSSIPVKELAKIIGMKYARKADLNKDGVVDIEDMQLFALGGKKGR